MAKQAAPIVETLDDIMRRINSEYGSAEYPVARLGTQLIQPGWIPTGNILMDVAIYGGRGYQHSTINQHIGYEGSGKSKATKRSIRAAQEAEPDKAVAVIAAERGDYTPESLIDEGIDPDRIVVIQDMPAEYMLQSLHEMVWNEQRRCPTNLLSMWAIDSAPMLVTEAQLNTKMTDAEARAELARCYSRFIPQINLHMGSTVGIIVNQLRQGQGATLADKKPHTTCGAMIRYASKVTTRFYDHAIEKEKGGKWSEQHDMQMTICMEAVKNNLIKGARGARVSYTVYLMEDGVHELGVDEVECLARAGLLVGVTKKAGAQYSITLDGTKYGAAGMDNFVRKLKEAGPDVLREIEQVIRAAAQDRLAKERTPLGRLVVTEDGRLADVTEVDDTTIQEFKGDDEYVDEETGEVIDMTEDTPQE